MMTKKLWLGLIAWMIMGTSVYYLGKKAAQWRDLARLEKQKQIQQTAN